MFLKKFLTVLCTLIVSGLMAKEYIAYKAISPPNIDGKLNDKCWQNIPMARGFTTPGANVYARCVALKQTGFKIAHDKHYLYLAVQCEEPEPERIVRAVNAKLDGYQDTDSIDFIYANTFAESKTKDQFRWVMAQMGVDNAPRLLKQGKKVIPFSPKWKFATTLDDKYWYLEAAIPFDMLKLNPQKGGFFNIVRRLKTGPENEKLTSWTVIGPKTQGTLDICHLATLKMSDKTGINPDDKVSNLGRMVPKIDLTEWELAGYMSGHMVGIQHHIRKQTGPYAEAKMKFGDAPGWKGLENAYRSTQKAYAGCIDDVQRFGIKVDAFYEWKRAFLKMKTISKPITLSTKQQDLTIQLMVNGQQIKPDRTGSYKLVLAEGLNTIAVKAVSSGQSPLLKFILPTYPEVEKRWRYSDTPGKDWYSNDFDDRKWHVVEDQNGSIWPAGSKTVYFRQNIIWSQYYHSGKLAALLPVVKEWGFSEDSTETFIHVLLNPLNFPLEKYQYIVELPEGFSLLSTKTYKRIKTNWYPEDVIEESVIINKKPYKRYTLTFDISSLPENTMYSAYLPIKHNGFSDRKANFRFYRLAKDNLTELTTIVPIKMLPPVNGRDMNEIIFQSYHISSLPLSKAHAKEMVKASVDMGLTSWLGMPELPFIKEGREAHRKWLCQTILNKGGKLDMWSPAGYPLWGAQRNTELLKLLAKNPKYKAVYFNNSDSKVPGWYHEFCFTYALGEGIEDFKKAIYKDYRRMLDCLPDKPKYVFLNDENYPWRSHHKNSETGKHTYCFCDRCKKAFKTFAKLPENLTLSDDDIFEKYSSQWAAFWKTNRSDRLMKVACDVLHELGVKVIYYHNFSDRLAYKLAAKHADLCSLTIPAVHVNTREQQVIDDRLTRDAHKLGIKRYMGQSRPYFSSVVGKGKARPKMYSKNGYFLQPEHLKIMVTRMTATNHAGILYEHPWQFAAGCKYYFGEATRLIHDYEDLFAWGKRDDKLATADKMAYPDIMVLKKGDERLVLIFNETDKKRDIILTNHQLKDDMKAEIWEKSETFNNPKQIKIIVPANDLVAIHISEKSFWDWLF